MTRSELFNKIAVRLSHEGMLNEEWVNENYAEILIAVQKELSKALADYEIVKGNVLE